MRLLQESLFIVLLGYNRAAACTLLPYMGVGSYGSPPSPPRILADVASLVLGTGSCPHEMSFNIIYLIQARSRSHCKNGTFRDPASSNQDPTRAFKIPWHKAQHLYAQTCHGKIQGNLCSGEVYIYIYIFIYIYIILCII